jgi:PAS domain-containing protein
MPSATLGVTLAQLSPTTLFTIPSSDLAFAEFVRRIAERTPPTSPAALQDRLRGVYPRALVRPRGLSSDDHTWYVYREGRWVDGRIPDWWADDSMPRIELDREGFITAANAAAGVELGVAPPRLVHRHFTDFAVPGSLDDTLLLNEIFQALGVAGGTIRHLRVGGEVRVAEYHATATGAGSTIAFKPIGRSDDVPEHGPTAKLDCRPERDKLFAVVAAGIVARIPEPTPEGLELRLRRSYPHATVVEAKPAEWRVDRDAGPARPPVDWAAPNLARTVALDTSLIVEANEAALELLGRDLVGRHWHELAVPSSLDRRLQMRDFYVANGGAESTFRLVGAGGRLVDYDYRLTWHGDRFTTLMSPFAIGAVALPAEASPSGGHDAG